RKMSFPYGSFLFILGEKELATLDYVPSTSTTPTLRSQVNLIPNSNVAYDLISIGQHSVIGFYSYQSSQLIITNNATGGSYQVTYSPGAPYLLTAGAGSYLFTMRTGAYTISAQVRVDNSQLNPVPALVSVTATLESASIITLLNQSFNPF